MPCNKFIPAMKPAIRKLLKVIGGDGHTIWDPKVLKDFPQELRERFTKTHKSRGGKFDITTDTGRVDSLEGIHGLQLLDALCDDLGVPQSSKMGRGFRAQENTANLVKFLQDLKEVPCKNQHGFFCPSCGESDDLVISANLAVSARLCGNGVEHDDRGDTTWEKTSDACCNNCDWQGQVKDLLVREDLT
jgi:hypothetical protein